MSTKERIYKTKFLEEEEKRVNRKVVSMSDCKVKPDHQKWSYIQRYEWRCMLERGSEQKSLMPEETGKPCYRSKVWCTQGMNLTYPEKHKQTKSSWGNKINVGKDRKSSKGVECQTRYYLWNVGSIFILHFLNRHTCELGATLPLPDSFLFLGEICCW